MMLPATTVNPLKKLCFSTNFINDNILDSAVVESGVLMEGSISVEGTFEISPNSCRLSQM